MNAEFLAAIERVMEKGGTPKYQKASHQSCPAAPKSALGQVTVVQDSTSSSYKLSWEETPDSSGYEIQVNDDPTQYRNWVSRQKVSVASADFELQTGEDRVWLRVRAMTTTGPGPWSDPVPVGTRLGRLKQAA